MEIFDNFNGISTLLIIGLFECIVTSIAMGWDFASGWHKAKLRKEKRNSYGMKRTVSKFILYFGSLTIALCLDSTFYVCHFFTFLFSFYLGFFGFTYKPYLFFVMYSVLYLFYFSFFCYCILFFVFSELLDIVLCLCYLSI